MLPLAAGIGIASAGVNLLGDIFGLGKSDSAINQMVANMPKRKDSDIPEKQLAMANALINARMSGAASAERNIYQSGANAMSRIQRGATDPNQVLLGAGAVLGQESEGFEKLGQLEAEDYQKRQQNLMASQQAYQEELDKRYADQLNRFQMEAQLRGQQAANTQSLFGNIGNLGMGLANVFAKASPITPGKI
jgi:hypothetical protein